MATMVSITTDKERIYKLPEPGRYSRVYLDRSLTLSSTGTTTSFSSNVYLHMTSDGVYVGFTKADRSLDLYEVLTAGHRPPLFRVMDQDFEIRHYNHTR